MRPPPGWVRTAHVHDPSAFTAVGDRTQLTLWGSRLP